MPRSAISSINAVLSELLTVSKGFTRLVLVSTATAGCHSGPSTSGGETVGPVDEGSDTGIDAQNPT